MLFYFFFGEFDIEFKVRIRNVFVGRGFVVICSVYARDSLLRELVLVFLFVVGCDILIFEEVMRFKRFIISGLREVIGWKKLYFRGKEKVLLRISEFIFV